jgi:hypothetical protein
MKPQSHSLSLITPLVIAATFLLAAPMAEAHPGNTAGDGCHYCRTNCDTWGVPWNERHCHGGAVTPTVTNPVIEQTPIAPKTVVQPTVIPKPFPSPSPSPSPSPLPEPSPSLSSSPLPSDNQEVLGASEATEKTETKRIGFFKRLLNWLFGRKKY